MPKVAALKWLGTKVAGLAPKAPPAPERVFGKARPMTGFLATLTAEQRERALAYGGEDSFGDASMEKTKA